MHFSCSQCQTRYSVPDERVRGKKIRTKCRKCGTEILIEGPKDGGATPDGTGHSTEERPTVPPPTTKRPVSLVPASVADAPATDATARGDSTLSEPAAPAPSEPPAAPSPKAEPDGFGFEGEATAVIPPDHARALLDAEMSKALGSPSPVDHETPLGFGFDDESTKVAEPERAEALLQERLAADEPAAFPPRRSDPPPEPEPSIVLDDALGAAKPRPKSPRAPATPKAPFPSELAAFQNEPTLVLRKKRRSSGTFWLVLVLALAAAAAGGFVAAQILGHDSASHHGTP